MGTAITTVILLIYCIFYNVHPNLIAVMLSILWTAYIVETKE